MNLNQESLSYRDVLQTAIECYVWTRTESSEPLTEDETRMLTSLDPTANDIIRRGQSMKEEMAQVALPEHVDVKLATYRVHLALRPGMDTEWVRRNMVVWATCLSSDVERIDDEDKIIACINSPENLDHKWLIREVLYTYPLNFNMYCVLMSSFLNTSDIAPSTDESVKGVRHASIRRLRTRESRLSSIVDLLSNFRLVYNISDLMHSCAFVHCVLSEFIHGGLNEEEVASMVLVDRSHYPGLQALGFAKPDTPVDTLCRSTVLCNLRRKILERICRTDMEGTKNDALTYLTQVFLSSYSTTPQENSLRRMGTEVTDLSDDTSSEDRVSSILSSCVSSYGSDVVHRVSSFLLSLTQSGTTIAQSFRVTTSTEAIIELCCALCVSAGRIATCVRRSCNETADDFLMARTLEPILQEGERSPSSQAKRASVNMLWNHSRPVVFSDSPQVYSRIPISKLVRFVECLIYETHKYTKNILRPISHSFNGGVVVALYDLTVNAERDIADSISVMSNISPDVLGGTAVELSAIPIQEPLPSVMLPIGTPEASPIRCESPTLPASPRPAATSIMLVNGSIAEFALSSPLLPSTDNQFTITSISTTLLHTAILLQIYRCNTVEYIIGLSQNTHRVPSFTEVDELIVEEIRTNQKDGKRRMSTTLLKTSSKTSETGSVPQSPSAGMYYYYSGSRDSLSLASSSIVEHLQTNIIHTTDVILQRWKYVVDGWITDTMRRILRVESWTTTGGVSPSAVDVALYVHRLANAIQTGFDSAYESFTKMVECSSVGPRPVCHGEKYTQRGYGLACGDVIGRVCAEYTELLNEVLLRYADGMFQSIQSWKILQHAVSPQEILVSLGHMAATSNTTSTLCVRINNITFLKERLQQTWSTLSHRMYLHRTGFLQNTTSETDVLKETFLHDSTVAEINRLNNSCLSILARKTVYSVPEITVAYTGTFTPLSSGTFNAIKASLHDVVNSALEVPMRIAAIEIVLKEISVLLAFRLIRGKARVPPSTTVYGIYCDVMVDMYSMWNVFVEYGVEEHKCDSLTKDWFAAAQCLLATDTDDVLFGQIRSLRFGECIVLPRPTLETLQDIITTKSNHQKEEHEGAFIAIAYIQRAIRRIHDKEAQAIRMEQRETMQKLNTSDSVSPNRSRTCSIQ